MAISKAAVASRVCTKSLVCEPWGVSLRERNMKLMLSLAAFSSLSAVWRTRSPGATDEVCARSDRLRAKIKAAALRVRPHVVLSRLLRPKHPILLVLYRDGFTNGIRLVARATLAAKKPPAWNFSGTAESRPDRKSTRLNSSHVAISYAVFCLK